MDLFRRGTGENSGDGGRRSPARTRIAAGLVGLAAFVSVFTVAANPDREVAAPESSTEIVVTPDGGEERESPIEVSVTCDAAGLCRIPTPVGQTGGPTWICPGLCEEHDDGRDATLYSVLIADSNGPSDYAVIRGLERRDGSSRIAVVPADTASPTDDFVEIEIDNGRINFDEQGDSGIDLRTTRAAVPSGETEELPNGSPAFNDGARGVVSLLILALGIAAAVATFVAVAFGIKVLLEQPRERRTSRWSRDDDDDDEDADALATPLTFEVAEERAAVVRDLLDRVREVDDPRLSIQTGFATLESGFGGSNLVRGRNETAARYVNRILGSGGESREALSEIVALFERARFSELPVDAAMRTRMIERLEQVQQDWERRAFELSQTAPAAPAAMPQPVEVDAP